MRNNVSGFDFPTQRIRRVDLQAADSAPKIIDFNHGLSETPKSQSCFFCHFYKFPSSIERLVIFRSRSCDELVDDFLDFVRFDRQRFLFRSRHV